LLIKINRDFGVTGHLLLQIDSFPRDRVARIKIGDNVGEWIESLLGTSAGTSLGPLLFIVHVAAAEVRRGRVQVITGILPFRFHKRELCCREFVRMITQDNSQELKQLLQSTVRVGLRFCPLEYIRVMSR